MGDMQAGRSFQSSAIPEAGVAQESCESLPHSDQNENMRVLNDMHDAFRDSTE
jgi:hypothetical protein